MQLKCEAESNQPLLDSATSGQYSIKPLRRIIQMALNRNPKPYEVVAVEPPALEELPDSVLKIPYPHEIAGAEPPAGEALRATSAGAGIGESPAQHVERFFDLIIDEL